MVRIIPDDIPLSFVTDLLPVIGTTEKAQFPKELRLNIATSRRRVNDPT